MDFSFKNSQITIVSDKKEIILTHEKIILAGLDIEMPGEYEKSGCLMYAFEKNNEKLYHFRTEGYWLAYLPTIPADISPEALDFLGSIDILVMPGSRAIQPIIEKIEPRLLITYGELSHEIGMVLGYHETPTSKYRLKDTDLSSDKTNCIVMGE